MNRPKFSVIIPTYNSEQTISDAIESVLRQTNTSFELIVVDGGSSDNTLLILGRFSHHIANIVSEKDEGTYDAMNKGIRRAKGEWIYLLGSDDKFASCNVLSEVSNQIGDLDSFVYGNVKIVGATAWARDGDIYDGEFPIDKLLQKNICQQAIFYNSAVFDTRNFNIGYKLCADWDFNIYCFANFKPKYLNMLVAEYNGLGLSSSKEDLDFKQDMLVNTAIYFRNNLMRKDLESSRLLIRKVLGEKDSRLTFVVRSKIWVSMVLVQIRVWANRLIKTG